MRTTARRTIGHRSTLRRTLATAAVLGVVGATSAACGEEDFGSSEVDTTYADVEGSSVTTDSIVGLEVTTVGNVVDVLSEEAIRVDRDGLGPIDDDGVVTETEVVYDYAYYDYGYLTAYDQDFGDDDLDEGVLVVGALDALADQDVDDEVRVSGTIRRYDQDVLEEIYELELPRDEFDDAGETLVIVADSVAPADQAPEGTNDPATADPDAGEATDDSGDMDDSDDMDEATDGASEGTEESPSGSPSESMTSEDEES